MIDVALALEHLVPAAKYGGPLTANTRGQYEEIRWLDKREKPTWQDIQAAWKELEPELVAAYITEKRRKAYPDLGDQLDAIWKALNYAQMTKSLKLPKETDAVLGKVLAVKRNNPKPE